MARCGCFWDDYHELQGIDSNVFQGFLIIWCFLLVFVALLGGFCLPVETKPFAGLHQNQNGQYLIMCSTCL